jgi:hypothetical protein
MSVGKSVNDGKLRKGPVQARRRYSIERLASGCPLYQLETPVLRPCVRNSAPRINTQTEVKIFST